MYIRSAILKSSTICVENVYRRFPWGYPPWKWRHRGFPWGYPLEKMTSSRVPSGIPSWKMTYIFPPFLKGAGSHFSILFDIEVRFDLVSDRACDWLNHELLTRKLLLKTKWQTGNTSFFKMADRKLLLKTKCRTGNHHFFKMADRKLLLKTKWRTRSCY